jgi:hypothetical protein
MRSAAAAKPAAPDALALDIRNRLAEIAAIEAAGPSLATNLVNAEAELVRAHQHYRRYGFVLTGRTPSEREHYQQLSIRGALMEIGGDKLLAAEKSRIESNPAFHGIDGPEKRERVRALQAALQPLYAMQEMAWRKTEAGGQAVDRGASFSPPHYLASDADLAIAAEGERVSP